MTTTELVSAPPCPRCHRAPIATLTMSGLLVVWARVHCTSCTIGRGAETIEEATALWVATVKRWNR